MIAYQKDWLDALLIRQTARRWREKDWITAAQWQAIQARFVPGFYSPNLFIRIGLAIFTLILLFAAGGMLAMILEPNSEVAFSVFGMVCGIACLVFLEQRIVRAKQHKGSGIDDTLLYTGVWAVLLGMFNLFPYNTPPLLYCCIALPFLVVTAIRYLDRLMALAAFICSFAIVFLIVKEIPGVALYLLPFSGMIAAASCYFFSKNGQKRYEWRHWQDILMLLELLSLITFYASGNYWVVQQAGATYFGLETMPIPWLFWGFTYAVPLLYLFFGLKWRDRIMLDTGLACVGATVFTFRFYFSVLPLTWAAVICGAVLFVTAYFSIRYLHRHEGAFTYEPEQADASLLQEIEEQLIEQTIVNQPGPQLSKDDGFGGGQFGGGGAGDKF